VTARFGSGLTRRLAPVGGGDIRILPEWWLHTVLAFPEKGDFEGQRALLIELEVAGDEGERCAIPIQFERAAGAAASPSSYVAHSEVEVGFGAGVRMPGAGSLGLLGPDPGPSLELSIRSFPWFHYGLSFDLAIDNFGSEGIPIADPDLEPGRGAAITAVGLFAGYAVRLYWCPWLSSSYGLSTGPYVFELYDGWHQLAEHTAVVFPLRQQLRIPARIARLASGGEVALGLSLSLTTVAYGRLGVAELRGSSLTSLLTVTLGG